MARVSGPLFSMTASGRVDALVYDRRGLVRRFVPPANPRTESQGEVRERLAAVQRGVSAVGDVTKVEVQAAFVAQGKPAYRWNALLLQSIIQPDAWAAIVTAYNALGAAQANWQSEAATLGLVDTKFPYSGGDGITAGCVLFAVASALYGLDIYPGNGAPANTNAATWRDSIED